MVELDKTLGRLVFGGDAERYHTYRTIRAESVHHHSAIVGHLAMLLAPTSWNIAARHSLLLASLRHDLGEGSNDGYGTAAAGDLPSPTKRGIPGLKEAFDKHEDALLAADGVIMPMLSKDEQRVLKLADYMSGMIFCVQEKMLGSCASNSVFDVYVSYIMDLEMDQNQRDIFTCLWNWWQNAHTGRPTPPSHAMGAPFKAQVPDA